MKFPYLKFPSSDPKRQWIVRPLIPVRLTGPKGQWEGYALIDSGADRSLFNIEVTKEIGLDLESSPTENFSGIEGGILKAKLSKVNLQIIGMEQKVWIIAGFVDSPSVGAILGQDGFFDAFKIKFEKDHGIIEIALTKKQANRAR